MIQFSLIDTRPLHGMADVCEKHNIKLLTYGTFVRIAFCFLRASPSGLSYAPPPFLPLHTFHPFPLAPALPPPISLPGSVAVFSQMRGLTGPNLIRIRAL